MTDRPLTVSWSDPWPFLCDALDEVDRLRAELEATEDALDACRKELAEYRQAGDKLANSLYGTTSRTSQEKLAAWRALRGCNQEERDVA